MTYQLDLREPEELTERLQPLAPGVRIVANASCRFRARIRAWNCQGAGFFTYSTRQGSAHFGKDRDYVATTLPLHSSFAARIGRRQEEVQHGRTLLLEPGTHGIVTPRAGAHVLGLAIEAAALEAQRHAVSGSWNQALPPLPAFVSTETESGRRLLRTLGRTCAELCGADAGLDHTRIARERIDTITALLAEASVEAAPVPAKSPSDASFRCAEEVLSTDLSRPLSLADVARELGTSTRSLSRAFLTRHGMGPVAFRRLRRFEAARRDLFLADPGKTTVTDTALRYGFGHLGRFAVDYRKLFGEVPSETLRH
jgi:AraC-like DNA-binding protein